MEWAVVKISKISDFRLFYNIYINSFAQIPYFIVKFLTKLSLSLIFLFDSNWKLIKSLG